MRSVSRCATTLGQTPRPTYNAIPQKILTEMVNDQRYDSKERPVARGGPTTVVVKIYIRDISSVDEKSFQFTADLDIQLAWQDPRLAFSGKTDTSPDDYLTVRADTVHKIWMPDLYFENTKGKEKLIQQDEKIYPNGTIFYTRRIVTVLSCALKLQNYPLDTQTVYIQVGSYAYTERDVLFQWTKSEPPITRNAVMTLPTFSFVSYDAEPYCSDVARVSNKEKFTCIQAKLVFERFYEFHILQSYLPTILLVVASWISFWIDPAAIPARITLSVTTLLSIVSMASAIRIGLPSVSYLKAIDVWMFTCIFFIFAALLEFSIMSHALMLKKQGKTWTGDLFAACRRKKKPTPGEPETTTMNPIPPNSETPQGPEKISPAPAHPAPAPPAPPKPPSAKYDIDRMSRFAFPLSFILFNIIYWTTYKGT